VNNLPVIILFSEEDPIHEGLDSIPQGIEYQDDNQCEDDRENPGLGNLVLAEENVEKDTDHNIGTHDDSSHDDIAYCAFDDGIRIKEVVSDNGVGNGGGEENQKEDHEIPGKVDLQEMGQRH
jgi:hypothetical protein